MGSGDRTNVVVAVVTTITYFSGVECAHDNNSIYRYVHVCTIVLALQLQDLTLKLEDLQEDQKDGEEYRQRLKKDNSILLSRYTMYMIMHV